MAPNFYVIEHAITVVIIEYVYRYVTMTVIDLSNAGFLYSVGDTLVMSIYSWGKVIFLASMDASSYVILRINKVSDTCWTNSFSINDA